MKYDYCINPENMVNSPKQKVYMFYNCAACGVFLKTRRGAAAPEARQKP